MRQCKEMDTKFVTLLVISALLVAAVYSSSSTLKVFGNIVKNIGCSPTDGGKKVTCCGGEYDSKGNHVGYWCTTCDNTQPPSNCTDRYKGLVVVNPGKVISDVLQGGVAENPTTTPQLERDVGSRGEFRELPESNKTFSRANISALD